MTASAPPAARRAHYLVLLATLMALWVLWSGHIEWFLLGVGIAASLLVTWVAARMRIIDDEGEPLVPLLWRPLFYLPWLAWQIVLSNIAVARCILSPSLPISPTLIELSASQRTELGQVIYANSITLTPGTITIRIRDGVILVHALTREAAEGLVEGEMDRRVTAVEGGGNV